MGAFKHIADVNAMLVKRAVMRIYPEADPDILYADFARSLLAPLKAICKLYGYTAESFRMASGADVSFFEDVLSGRAQPHHVLLTLMMTGHMIAAGEPGPLSTELPAPRDLHRHALGRREDNAVADYVRRVNKKKAIRWQEHRAAGRAKRLAAQSAAGAGLGDGATSTTSAVTDLSSASNCRK